MTHTSANRTLIANAEAAHRLVITAEYALRRLADELDRDLHELTEATVTSGHFQSLRTDLRADLTELSRLREHLFRIGQVAEMADHGPTYREATRRNSEATEQATGLQVIPGGK